jgi:hypothetical protein
MQIAGARGYRSASPPPDFLSIAKKKEKKKSRITDPHRARAPQCRATCRTPATLATPEARPS